MTTPPVEADWPAFIREEKHRIVWLPLEWPGRDPMPFGAMALAVSHVAAAMTDDDSDMAGTPLKRPADEAIIALLERYGPRLSVYEGKDIITHLTSWRAGEKRRAENGIDHTPIALKSEDYDVRRRATKNSTRGLLGLRLLATLQDPVSRHLPKAPRLGPSHVEGMREPSVLEYLGVAIAVGNAAAIDAVVSWMKRLSRDGRDHHDWATLVRDVTETETYMEALLKELRASSTPDEVWNRWLDSGLGRRLVTARLTGELSARPGRGRRKSARALSVTLVARESSCSESRLARVLNSSKETAAI